MGDAVGERGIATLGAADSGAPVTGEAVADLIRRAAAHPLGLEFLIGGALDAVCATFGVHAFLVDAARDDLAGAG